MKLKYYMRGLGLGIILTTLILSICNPKEKLSDAEIKERAQTLGMVTKDESGLDKALNNLELTLTPVPTQAPTAVPTKVPTPIPTVKPTEKPKKEPTQAPAPTVVPADKKTAQKIPFTIQSGMSSGKVAKELVSKGIIKDADDFNQYIVKVGKASIIRVGNYAIEKNASYDNIIKLITTKNK